MAERRKIQRRIKPYLAVIAIAQIDRQLRQHKAVDGEDKQGGHIGEDGAHHHLKIPQLVDAEVADGEQHSDVNHQDAGPRLQRGGKALLHIAHHLGAERHLGERLGGDGPAARNIHITGDGERREGQPVEERRERIHPEPKVAGHKQQAVGQRLQPGDPVGERIHPVHGHQIGEVDLEPQPEDDPHQLQILHPDMEPVLDIGDHRPPGEQHDADEEVAKDIDDVPIVFGLGVTHHHGGAKTCHQDKREGDQIHHAVEQRQLPLGDPLRQPHLEGEADNDADQRGPHPGDKGLLEARERGVLHNENG